MTDLEATIHTICRQAVLSAGFIFIDVKFRGSKSSRIIEVYADAETSLTIEDCARISTAISEEFEQKLDPGFSYRLDVSSPGADNPLTDIRQFKKHAGRTFQIDYSGSGDETVSVTAKLKSAGEDTLVFELKDKSELVLEFSRIRKAVVKISFK
ncbi:MAG: hypothetical protein HRU80_16445 [Ignavibacteriales bacterium]|nr:hypothetical protein [Ignavibacteriaceae bacterium]QOJ30375.1 MAG: hypothetical protein HRU80_16445 [Ignavibacteriales bacterium]